MRFRPRFSLRMLFTLTIMVALGCGLWVRSRDLTYRALVHWIEVHKICFYPHMILDEDGSPRPGSDSGPVSPEIRRMQYHYQMALKYFDAAQNPWLPLEPDPPVPQ